MSPNPQNTLISKAARMLVAIAIVVFALVGPFIFRGSTQTALACPIGTTFPGTEAFNSTITLQMPFIAGQQWTVGGAGSFYGNGSHCNAGIGGIDLNDYYATDWNRADGTASLGSAVLTVADGTVVEVKSPPNCLTPPSYGCYVKINHASGYQTLYAHLSSTVIGSQATVHPWTLIGKVGATGLTDPNAAHLHLSFRHFDNGGYFSHCYNNGTPCPNGEAAWTPQGYKPSPMLTSLGPTTLTDGSTYTSVNGRVYLPDLRNSNNWFSELYVRNNGNETRNVKIYYFDVNGNPMPTASDICALITNQRCWIPISTRFPANTNGSAYVDGGEDVSVVVTQGHVNPTTEWAAYNGIHQPISTIHVPLLHKNNFGIYSEVFIWNNGPSTTQITVQFKPSPGQSGSNCTQNYPNVPAKGVKVVSLINIGCIGSQFVGSAYITNNGNNWLAVTSTQYYLNGTNMSESNNPVPANTVYAPIVQNGNYGWTSGIALQNASSSSNNLTATYYTSSGSSCHSNTYNNISSRVSQIIGAPGGQCPTVVSAVFSGGTKPVAGIVNQVLSGSPPATDYETVNIPSTIVIIPLWKYQTGAWISGFIAQNTTGQTVNGSILFYDANGNRYGSGLPMVILANGSYTGVNIGPPDGSAVLHSDRPIAVVVNQSLTTSGDGGMTTTAEHR